MKQDEKHQPINGRAWTNVDIVGTVTPESSFRLQDDFHAAVNRDWLATAEIRPGNSSESSFWERMREVQAQVEEILADDTPATHEAQLVHTLYQAFLDMDARNARGMDPVRPLIGRIRGVKSLDELSELLSGEAFLFTTTLTDIEPFADKKDSVTNVVYIDRASLSLSDANEYRDMSAQGERMKAANETYFAKMLERVGYTPDEAADAVARMFSLEQRIAAHCLGNDARAREDFEEITYNPADLAGLRAMSPDFPLAGILTALGFDESRRFILGEPEWLEALNDLYTPENLEDFKAMLAIRTLMRFGSYLDQEAYDLTEQWGNDRMGSVGSTPLTRKAYDVCNGLLGMAVGRQYVDRYLAPSTKEAVEKLIAQAIAVYRERLANADWLSEATSAKAAEKLDAMTVRVGRPTSWPAYEELSFAPDASLVDMYMAIARFENRRARAKVNQPVDREEWLMNPQSVNAYYLPTDNSINILAGILGGVFFDEDGGIEEVMGGIGMVVAHEITHAFDKHGSQYDKNGNLGQSWWTDEDRAAFTKLTDRVAQYWNGIEVLPGLNVDGDLCVGETVADLGGMACMCQVAHGIEGFDYAKMFEAYARDWRTVESQPLAEYLLINDVHAPAHLRTNATVQHLQEFYDAFDVQPGDGMYLTPEDRLRVW